MGTCGVDIDVVEEPSRLFVPRSLSCAQYHKQDARGFDVAGCVVMGLCTFWLVFQRCVVADFSVGCWMAFIWRIRFCLALYCQRFQCIRREVRSTQSIRSLLKLTIFEFTFALDCIGYVIQCTPLRGISLSVVAYSIYVFQLFLLVILCSIVFFEK